MTKQLTKKQACFVDEYLIDLNATKAAIRAGYAKSTAEKKAPLWVGKSRKDSPFPHVWDAVQKALAERSERTKIDADYVLTRHKEIDQMDVLDILDDYGNLLPISSWPLIWRQFLSGMDVSELFEGKGDDREVIGVLKKIKWPDKLKNLELLGKHVEVQAYREQAKTTHDFEPGQNVNITIVGK